jgi:hypothetical protein
MSLSPESWQPLSRLLDEALDLARSALESAIQHLEPTVGHDHPELVRARRLLARVQPGGHANPGDTPGWP